MSNKTFKWDAELYQRSSSGQFKLGIMAIERLNPKDSDEILEIGCGNALLTIELAKRISNGNITAIELSEDMIAKAKKNISQYGIENISIIKMNAIDLNFKNKFNIVFSNSAIHWIKNLELMYNLIYNSLKPNGRIMIQTAVKQKSIFFKSIDKTSSKKEYGKYIKNNFNFPWRFLTIKETKKILKNIGFNEVVTDLLNFEYKFNNINEFKNFCKAAALLPYLNILPISLKEGFVNDFSKIYFKFNLNELGINMLRIFISAKK